MTAEADMSTRRRQYEDPPVVEAICRLIWAEAATWDITVPGRLYESLRDLYPDGVKAQGTMQAEVQPNAGLEFRNGPQRLVFSAQDNSRLFTVGPAEASAHSLRPYEGWDSLKRRLGEGVQRLAKVQSIGEVKAVTLRYINRIEIPQAQIKFTDYFTIAMVFPPTFPPALVNFLDKAEFDYPDNESRLVYTWASVDAPEGKMAFLVDLDMLWNPQNRTATLSEAFEALDALKAKEGLVFESLLQPRLREMFGESS